MEEGRGVSDELERLRSAVLEWIAINDTYDYEPDFNALRRIATDED